MTTNLVVRHRLAPTACARKRWDHGRLNHTLIEVVMAITGGNGSERELKARPWQLQDNELEAQHSFLCPMSAKGTGGKTDLVQDISWTEVKHKREEHR
jgi:hypothetical protein